MGGGEVMHGIGSSLEFALYLWVDSRGAAP